MTYATILIHAEQKSEALKQANQALEIAKDNGEPVKKIQGMIQYLQSSWYLTLNSIAHINEKP